jgi:hypothetical protein
MSSKPEIMDENLNLNQGKSISFPYIQILQQPQYGKALGFANSTGNYL